METGKTALSKRGRNGLARITTMAFCGWSYAGRPFVRASRSASAVLGGRTGVSGFFTAAGATYFASVASLKIFRLYPMPHDSETRVKCCSKFCVPAQHFIPQPKTASRRAKLLAAGGLTSD